MKEELTGSKSPSWANVYLYKKLKEKTRGCDFIRPKQLITEMKLVFKIPPTLHYPILKQMEEEGLIKRINHQKYEISQEQKKEKLKEINLKLKDIINVGRRSRMLKAMEECELITKAKGTKYMILESDCDKKLEVMGNYTFW